MFLFMLQDLLPDLSSITSLETDVIPCLCGDRVPDHLITQLAKVKFSSPSFSVKRRLSVAELIRAWRLSKEMETQLAKS